MLRATESRLFKSLQNHKTRSLTKMSPPNTPTKTIPATDANSADTYPLSVRKMMDALPITGAPGKNAGANSKAKTQAKGQLQSAIVVKGRFSSPAQRGRSEV